jgi:ParB/RepB/Spo0J family partition protein
MVRVASRPDESGRAELIPLERLSESPFNPRKTFDRLDELAASIRAHGILQPLVVRLIEAGYEIVCGHRRARAARIASLDVVPVIVRHFATVADIIEAQVAENCEREDIHPLEEADAYAALSDAGRTPEQIADRLGKPVAYVLKRLQLRALSEKAKTAFRKDRIPLGVAQLLARIPNTDFQDEALDMVAASGDGDGMSVRDAATYIQARFMLRLSEAPFDRKDGKLVPEAGTCGSCPKRTGNQPNLFEDVSAKDTCTDPKCFASKVEANWQRAVKTASRQGLGVLDAKTAKQVFGSHDDAPRHWAAYLDPTQQHPRDPEHRSWKELLGKESPKPMLARTPRGVPIKLVSRKAAEDVLLSKGIAFDAMAKREEELQADAEPSPYDQARAARERANLAADSVIRRLTVAFGENGICPEAWAVLLRIAGEALGAFEPDADEARKEAIATAIREGDARVMQAWLAELLLGLTIDDASRRGQRPAELETLAPLYDIDYAAVERDVATETSAPADAEADLEEATSP